jgi:hypothetical protein
MKLLIFLFTFAVLPVTAYSQKNPVPVNEHQPGCLHFHKKKARQLLHKFLTKNKFKKSRQKYHLNNLSINQASVLKAKKDRMACRQIHNQIAKQVQNAKPLWKDFNEATYFKLKNFYFVIYADSYATDKHIHNGMVTLRLGGPSDLIIIYNNKFKEVRRVYIGGLPIN